MHPPLRLHRLFRRRPYLRSAITFRAAALVALACTAASGQAQFLSPGELSHPHRELGSDSDCTRCHAEGGRSAVETKLCTACHEDIGRQRSQGRGLHGTRFKREACGHCHVEHLGRSHTLIRWPGGSEREFEHELTDFSLKDKHAAVACRACHDQRNQRGAATFLAAPSTCHGCHNEDDVHEGRFGKECQDCHGAQGWTGAGVEAVDHDRTRFPLKGEHGSVECAACHGDPPRYRDLEFAACTACHEDPHEDRLGKRCERCHQESAWDALAMARSEHPGLSLRGGHARVACDTCHDQGNLQPPARGERCAGCHEPVHEADFGRACERCHRGIRWLGLPERLGREVHARTRFALEGRHASVACADCHAPQLPRSRRYRGLPYERCSGCHEDVHGGRLARFGDGDCTTCHDARGFQPTLFTVEMHVDARFPLLGRHVAVPCKGCHEIAPPRLDWSVDQRACTDCHENPHGDQFAQELSAGGCASCHSPVAWDVPNIDHSTWPLTGAHELAACVSCHAPVAGEQAGRTSASYRGAPRACEGCHRDPHLGQFRLSEPARTCDFCHTTTRYAVERFDHQRKAAYALLGKHGEVACAGCHPVATLQNGRAATRYRLGYRQCGHCHADPHAGGER